MHENNMIGIIPFTYFAGLQKAAGSTYLRVEQLVVNAPDFEIWMHGQKYESLIFQKAYWIEMMETFRGPKILDLCDPDWLDGSVDIIEIGNLVDAITCSSEKLSKLLRGYFPKKIVEHVPDRLNFDLFPERRKPHQGRAKRAIWFGFVNNAYETLIQLHSAIVKYDLELIIIADRPYTKEDCITAMNPSFIYYHNNTILTHLKEADIVLNPRSEKAKFKYKSNNKTIISLKMGVPVAESLEDIDRLMDPFERNKAVENAEKHEEDYNIKKSIDQYKRIISEIKNRIGDRN